MPHALERTLTWSGSRCRSVPVSSLVPPTRVHFSIRATRTPSELRVRRAVTHFVGRIPDAFPLFSPRLRACTRAYSNSGPWAVIALTREFSTRRASDRRFGEVGANVSRTRVAEEINRPSGPGNCHRARAMAFPSGIRIGTTRRIRNRLGPPRVITGSPILPSFSSLFSVVFR